MEKTYMLRAMVNNLLKYKKVILIASLLLLISSFFNVLTPYFIMKILDESIPLARWSSLLINIGLALGATLLYNCTKLLADYVFSKLARDFVIEIRSRCISMLQKLDGDYYTKISSGDLLKTLFEDIENIQETVTYSFVVLLPIC